MLELHNTSLLNLVGDSFAYDCINLAVSQAELSWKRSPIEENSVYFMVEIFYPASNNINSLWQSSEIYEI